MVRSASAHLARHGVRVEVKAVPSGGLAAGDAILAEFQSAVEAVRCAVDVQESLRARNLAYPVNRHMNFRIGIT